MTAKFEYTDVDGILKEAEAFIVKDYTTTAKPNSPLMTRSDGTVDPSIIPAGSGTKPEYEPHYLTQEQLGSKKIILSKIPVYNSIKFIPEGGIPQRNRLDFVYDDTDNSITWNGLGLDGHLEENEFIEIFYQSH